MSKKVKIVLGVSLIIFAIVVIVVWTMLGGDDNWQPTFEEAFEKGKNPTADIWTGEQYEVKESVGKIYYSNSGYWLYHSESDELGLVIFKYDNKKEKWKAIETGTFGNIANLFSELKNPSEGWFAMTIDNENLWGCRVHDGLTPYVNGEKARIYATYSIEYNGTTYSVDWWDIVGFDHNLYDTMTLEFLAE